MHRNHRLTEIVRILRSHERVNADQLAEHFQVSPRTIYRDVALLHRMGVPVVGEAGIGYHLDHDARLEAVQFTADELRAMFQSAQASLADAEPRAADAILRAMTKVKEALPTVLLDALLDGPYPFSITESAADPEPLLEQAS